MKSSQCVELRGKPSFCQMSMYLGDSLKLHEAGSLVERSPRRCKCFLLEASALKHSLLCKKDFTLSLLLTTQDASVGFVLNSFKFHF